MTGKLDRKDFIWIIISVAIILGSFLTANPLYMVLGIFLGSLLLWINVAIDWTCFISLFFLGCIPLFGFTKTFSGVFGNSTVAFLIFTFALVYPLSKTNFVRRCTLLFVNNKISRIGNCRFMMLLFSSLLFMGLFISPSVLFVMFVPVLLDIMEVLHIEKGSKIGNVLMMGSAIVVNLSSGMTAIGHVWPTMALGYYNSATGKNISQIQYMLFGIPIGILLMFGMFMIFKFIYKPDMKFVIDWEKIEDMQKSLPKADKREKTALTVIGIVVALWVLPSIFKGILPGVYESINSLGTATPPLFGCILLSIFTDEEETPIMQFKEVSTKGILWGAIIMTGTATYLGSCMTNEEVGLVSLLKETLTPLTANLAPIFLVLFFVAWAILETNFSSNIVTTTVVCTVVVSVVAAIPSINMAAMLSVIGFSAAICNMTPAGQATVNTVAIGTGYVEPKNFLIYGGYFALLATIIIALIGYPLANLIM